MSVCRHNEASTTMSPFSYGTDGALDRVLRLGQRQKSAPAIFIHAGAGFHSHQNEHVHLEACNSAAEMGMRFLKAGATATEAIEAALRILEDKEITNAGYGSNLSIDGTVECDATIVDHLGRSGACGAVPNIRNPISLAKLILDTSNMPLSLRRVPPNILVGDGARTFAEEHGMVTFANEFLVSKNSRDRFFRWQEDLQRAEGRAKDTRLTPSTMSPPTAACFPCQYETTPHPKLLSKSFPRDHAAAILAGTWNEGQPDSPYAGTPLPEPSLGQESALNTTPLRAHPSCLASPARSPVRSVTSVLPTHSPASSLPDSKAASRHPGVAIPGEELATVAVPNGKVGNFDEEPALVAAPNRNAAIIDDGCLTVGTPDVALDPYPDGPASATRQHDQASLVLSVTGDVRAGDLRHRARRLKRPFMAKQGGDGAQARAAKRPFLPQVSDGDFITDTVGAIAIDERGRIAAGSSSGGIGMKHRGRLGPAALVGIGTAIVPCAEDDDDGLTVAAVTSGTGEHMATTMASQRCAERIYRGTRRGRGSYDIRDDDDDAIMESFIARDFMDHPGVKNCHSAGAIGVMVVKKSRAGYYLYFAHNTDSFALASMGALEREPRCTMSRLPEGAEIAKGGRKIRIV